MPRSQPHNFGAMRRLPEGAMRWLALALQLLLAALMLGLQPQAQAQTQLYWDTVGGNGQLDGGNGNWDGSTTNWATNTSGTGRQAWLAGSTAMFIASGGGTVTVSGTQSVANLTVNNNGYTIQGGVLQLSQSASFNIGDGYTATISSVVDGASGYTFSKDGAGTLTLGATNTYSGPTSVNNGTLVLTGFLGGANRSYGGDLYVGGPTGKFSYQNGSNYQYITGAVSGGGIIENTASSGLVFSGSTPHTFNGTYRASGNGYLHADTDGVLGTGATVMLEGTGGKLALKGNTQTIAYLRGDGTVLNNLANTTATLTVANNSDHTFSGGIQDQPGGGKMALAKSGPGTFTLAGNNIYTGDTTVNAGTLVLAGNNGVADGSGWYPYAGNIAINGGIFKYSRSDTKGHYFSGVVSGGGIFESAAGLMTFNGTTPHTLTGSYLVDGGATVYVDTANVLSGGALLNVNGTLSFKYTQNVAGLLGGGTINSNLQNQVSTLTVTNSTDRTFSGSIQDGNNAWVALTKSGAGKLTLTGSNIYSQPTTINGGILEIGAGGTTGEAPNTSGFSVASGATLAINRSDNFTLGKPVSGTGGLTHSGPSTSTVTVSAAQPYTGPTTISNGGTLFVQAGLGTNNADDYEQTGDIAVGTGVFKYNRSSSTGVQRLKGGLSGSGTFQLTGGQLAFTALTQHAFTGTYQVDVGGSLYFDSANVFGSGATLNVASGGYAYMQKPQTVTNLQGGGSIRNNGSAASTLTIDNSSGFTFSGSIADMTGKMGLTYSGAGTLTLAGNNSYSGDTTVSGGGTLVLAGNNGVPDGSGWYPYAGNVAITSGTFKYGRQDAAGHYFSGVVSGGGIFEAAGKNMTFNGTTPHTLTGSYQVDSGATVYVDMPNVLSGSAVLNVNGLLSFKGAQGVAGLLGGGTINSNLQNQVSTLTVTNSTDRTFSGSIQDGNNAWVALTKSGAGKLTLTGSNIYSQPTTINGGILEIGAGGTTGEAPNTSGFSVASGATLAINRSDNFTLGKPVSGTGGLTHSGPSTSTVTVSAAQPYTGPTTISNGGTLLVQAGFGPSTGGNDYQQTGDIAVGTGVVKWNSSSTGFQRLKGGLSGSGTFQVSSSNVVFTAPTRHAFTGTYQVDVGGSLYFDSANVFGDGATLNVVASDASNRGYVFMQKPQTVTNLQGGGWIRNNGTAASTLTVNNSSANTFSGLIADMYGPMALTKSGSGTLTLSGANTYTGATLVSAGTLQYGADNALPATSAITVQAGATLDLNGKVGGRSGTGTATYIDGTLNLGSGGSWTFTGTDDRVNVVSGSGTITIASGAKVTFNSALNGANVTVALQGGAAVLAAGTNTLGTLSLSGNSTLDLANGTLTLTTLTLGSNALQVNGYTAGTSHLYASAITDATTKDQTGVPPINQITLGASGNSNATYWSSTGNEVLATSTSNAATFWDGSSTIANGAVNGGLGTWSSTGTNWTTADGSANGTWPNNGTSVATFAGTSGNTVTVADSYTPSVGGLTFSTSGYGITGGTGSGITLANTAGNNTITVTNSGDTVNISTSLLGTAGMVKAGAGNLKLAGDNKYTGDTTVNGTGTLELAGNLGVPDTNGWYPYAGNIAINAGIFKYNRSDLKGHYFSGVVSGGGIFESAAGQMTFNGSTPHTLTGSYLVDGGATVYVDTANVLSGSALLNVNGTLSFKYTQNVAGLLGAGTINSNLQGQVSTLTVNNSTDRTFSGVIQDGTNAWVGLTKSGTGTQKLTGNNIYTQATTISAGTLQIGDGGTTGDVSVTSGVIVGANGTLALNRSDSYTFSRSVSGTGGLTKLGSGATTLSAISTYAGLTSVSGGTLTLTGNLGTTQDNTWYNHTGAVDIAAGATFTYNNANSKAQRINGVVSGAGTLAITNNALAFAGSPHTFTGKYAVSGSGTYMFTDIGGTFNGTASVDLGAGTIWVAQGAQSVTGLSGTGTVKGATTGVLTVVNSTTQTFGGTLADNGTGSDTLALTKTGSGTLTLTGANTYTGATTVNQGTLAYGSQDAVPPTSPITVAAGAKLDLGGQTLTRQAPINNLGDLVLNGSTIRLFGDNTATTISGSGVVIVPTGASLTLKGSFSNPDVRIALSGGTLVATGGTTVAVGILSVSGGLVSTLDLGGSAKVTATTLSINVGPSTSLVVKNYVAGTSSLYATAISPAPARNTPNVSPLNLITLGSNPAAATYWATAADELLAGNVPTGYWDGANTTADNVVQGGTGTWDATTTNWTTSQGNSNGPWAGGSTVANFGGTAGTVTVSGTQSIGGLSFGTAGYVLSGGTLDLTQNAGIAVPAAGTITLNSVLSSSGGSYGIAVSGGGTLVLDGTNTYTGTTTVSAGTLSVTGSTGNGAVTVGSGATLQGTGTVKGATTVQSGGSLRPGVGGVGQLSFGGDLTLASGSSTVFDLAKTGTSGGSCNDLVAVPAGNVVLGGTLTVTATSGCGSTFGVGSYPLFTYSGTVSGSFSSITVPAGYAGTIDTATTPGTVALVVSASTAATFWDATGANNSAVNGGTGVWDTTTANWTTVSGATNSTWSDGTNVAIFQGTGGTVTVSNTRSVGGMTFNTGGYVVSGGTGITLANPQGANTITVSNAGDTATIGTALTGSGGLAKAGAGTLVLGVSGGSANTFSGTVDVNAGTLVFGALASGGAADVSLGSASTVNVAAGAKLSIVDNTYSALTSVTRVFNVYGTFSMDGAGSQNAHNLTKASTINLINGGVLTSLNGVSGSAGDGGYGNVNINGSDGAALLNGIGTGNQVTMTTLYTSNGGTVGASDGGDLTIRSQVLGPSGFTKTGGGTVILANPTVNAYTGTTTVSAGTLQVGAGGTVGDLGTDSAGVTVWNGATLSFKRSNAFSLSKVISGEGSLSQDGTGTTTLSGTNTFSGGVRVNAGTLAFSANAHLGADAKTVNVAAGATLSYTDATAKSLDAAGRTYNVYGKFSMDGSTQNAHNFTAGTLNLINGGVLTSINGAGGVPNDGSNWGNFSLNGGTLNVTGTGNQISSSNVVFNQGSVNVNGGGELTVTAQIVGGGVSTNGPSKSGAGTMILANPVASTYTGPTTVTGGKLQVGNGGTVGDLGSSSGVALSSGTTLSFKRSNAYSVAQPISGAGGVTHEGSGTTTLTAANTYAGATTVTAGTLKYGSTTAVPNGSAISVSAGGSLDLGGQTIVRQADTNLLGPLVLSNGTITLSGNNTAAGITGTGTIIVPANTTLTLTAGFTNTSANITLQGGTLKVNGGLTVSLGTVTVSNNATSTLDMGTTNNVTVASLTFAAGTSNKLTVSNYTAGSSRLFATAINGSTTGVAQDNPNLAPLNQITLGSSQAAATYWASAGNELLAGTVPTGYWDGPNTVSDGTVQGGTGNWDGSTTNWATSLGGSNGLWPGGTTVANFGGSAGTVAVSGTQSLGGMTFTTAGYVLGGSGTLSLGQATTIALPGSGTTTIGNVIAGSYNLTIGGGGTLVLGGTNTYTGTTTVSSSTLQLTGRTGAGALTLGSAASLTGTGTVQGAATVQSGATLSPGIAGPGTLSVGGTLTLASGSSTNFDLAQAGTDGGACNDLVNVTAGNVVLGGTLTVTAASGASGCSSSFGLGSYTLFTYSGSVSGAFSSVVVPSGYIGTISTATAGKVILVVTASTVATFWDAVTPNNGAVDGGTGTWDGSTQNWTTASGTTNAVWPGSTNVATFQGAGGPYTVTVSGTQSIGGLTFNTTGYTLSGGSLNLAGTTNTITTTTGTSSIGSVLTGSNPLVFAGPGTTTLTGVNTYTGATSVNSGTLVLANAGGNVIPASNTVAVNNGATLKFGSHDNWGTAAAFNNSAAITVNSGGVMDTGTFFNSLNGLTLNNGTVNVQYGIGAYSAALYIKGTVTATGTSAFNNVSGGSVNLDTAGTTFNLPNASDTLTVAPILYNYQGSTASSLIKSGAGTLVLTGANAYTDGTIINAGKLQLGNGGTTGDISGTSGVTINGGTLSFKRSNAYTFSKAISGVGGISQDGSGTTTLNVANTYTGPTTVNAGTLVLATPSGNITPASNTIAVNNGGTLKFGSHDNWGTAAAFNTSAAITINSGGVMDTGTFFNSLNGLTLNSGTVNVQYGIGTYSAALYIKGTVTATGTSAFNDVSGGQVMLDTAGTTFNVANASDTLTVAPTINNYQGTTASALIKSGAGTLVLTGTNAYTNGTTVNAGKLQLGNGGSTGSLVGNLNLNGTSTALSVKRSDTGFAYSGVIGGSGAVSVDGTGTVTLSGTNTYTGATTVTSGTLKYGANAGVSASSAITVSSGATLDLGGQTNIIRSADTILNGPLNLSGGTITLSGNNNTAGSITGTGTIVLPANTTLTLTANLTNTSANITLQGGTLRLSPGVTVSLGTLTASNNVASTLDLNASGSLTVASLGFAAATSNTLTVSNYSQGVSRLYATQINGATTTARGTPNVAPLNQVTLGSNSAASTYWAASTNELLAGTSPISYWDGAATVANSVEGGSGTWNGSALNWTTSSGAGNSAWIGGTTVAVFQGTAGTVTVSGSQSIGGLTFSTSGYSLTGGTLTLAGSSNTITGSGSTTIGSVIAGGSGNALVFAGTGTTTLTGANTYTGSTTVNGGTLVLSSGSGSTVMPSSNTVTVNSGATLKFGTSNSFGTSTATATPAVTLNAGATLDSGGFFTPVFNLSLNGATVSANGGVSAQRGALQLGGTVTATGSSAITATGSNATINLGTAASQAVTVNVAGSGDSLAVATPLQNYENSTATALTKTGAGTLTLSGANTYTGGTTVSGGTLAVTGSLAAGAVTVANGATLKGTGTVAGATTVQSGGKLTPGMSPGTITFSNGLTLSSGSSTVFELGQANTVGGSCNDLVAVPGGTLVLGGTLTITATTGASGCSSTFAAGSYTLFTATGTPTGSFSSIVLPSGYTGTINTSTPGVVKLDVVASTTANFWDATLPNNNAVDGGTGAWDTTSSFWTTLSGAANTTWTDAANVAVFQGTAGTVTVSGTRTVGGMSFGVSGYAITGGTGITLAGATNPFTVGNSGDSASIVTPLTGSGAFSKEGAGTLTLSAVNTYSGGTTVNGGTLVLAKAGGPVTPVTDAITVNGGTLKMGATGNWGASTTSATAPITLNAGAVLDTGGFYNALLNLTLNGATVSANGGTGATYGALGLGGTVTATGTSAITATGSNATVNLGSSAAASTTFNVTGSSDSLSVATPLQNYENSTATALVKTGAGTLTLSGASTYTGATTVSAGTLKYGSAGGVPATSPITVAVGAKLDLGGQTLTRQADTIVNGDLPLNGGTITLSGNNNVAASISGSGTVYLLPNTTLTLSGSFTNTGVTIVLNGGTLKVAAGVTASVGPLTVSASSTLDLGNTGSLTTSSLVMGSTSTVLTVTGYGSGSHLYATNFIGSTGSAAARDTPNVNPVKQVTLGSAAATTTYWASGSNELLAGQILATYWDGAGPYGNNTINGGTGTWDATTAAWTNGSGSLTSVWSGGGNTANFGGTAGTVTVSGTQSIGGLSVTTPGYTLTGGTLNLAASGTISVPATGTTTIASVIASSGGTYGITTTGGTLVLGGANTYTGATTVSGGTLRYGVAGGVPAASVMTSAAGATLDINGLSVSRTANTTLSGPLALGTGGTATFNGGTHTLASVTGSGTIVVTGGASVTLTQVLSNAGVNITLSGGTLALAAGSTNTIGTLSQTASSTLDMVSGSAVSLTVGTLTLGSGTLTVSNWVSGSDHLVTSAVTSSPGQGTGYAGQAPFNAVVLGSNTASQTYWATTSNELLAMAPATTVTGYVFNDGGAPSGVTNTGTPNDGIKNGAEAGISGVTVSLTNCAATSYGSVTTDATGAFSLTVPSAQAGQTVCVVAGVGSGMTSTGASAGGTATPDGAATTVGGVAYTYSRSASRMSFMAPATGQLVLNFGQVGTSTLTPLTSTTTVQSGRTGVAAHSFTAGTGGSLQISLGTPTTTSAATGWTETVYLDAGCTGSLVNGATVLAPNGAALTVVQGKTVCVLVQEQVPPGAGVSDLNVVPVNFVLSLSNSSPALSATYTVTDTFTASASQLTLVKEVRNVTQGVQAWSKSNQAKPGEVLEYRITYGNPTSSAMTSLVVTDSTPTYTSFVSATTDTTPTALGNCVKVTPLNPDPAPAVSCTTTQTLVGTPTGSIKWTFSGQLNPGQTGTVLYQVKVD